MHLTFHGGDSLCRIDGSVRANSQSLFHVLVPAGHRLHVEIGSSMGSTSSQLTLYWRTSSPPSPRPGQHDGVVDASPILRCSWTSPASEAVGEPTLLHISLVNGSSRVARFALAAALHGLHTAVQHIPRRRPSDRRLFSLGEAARRVLLLVRVTRALRDRVLRQDATSGVPAAEPPRLSFRMLEARAYSYNVARGWDRITRGWQDMAYEAEQCCQQVRLWRDPEFPRDQSSIKWADAADNDDEGSPGSTHRSTPASCTSPGAQTDGAGKGPVVWLPLCTLMGQPHCWPNGRKSYLFPYNKHAAEVPLAAPPASTAQGSLGDCYFLTAVAATIRDDSLRTDLIDESLEEVC
jgi:hypothetical protein